MRIKVCTTQKVSFLLLERVHYGIKKVFASPASTPLRLVQGKVNTEVNKRKMALSESKRFEGLKKDLITSRLFCFLLSLLRTHCLIYANARIRALQNQQESSLSALLTQRKLSKLFESCYPTKDLLVLSKIYEAVLKHFTSVKPATLSQDLGLCQDLYLGPCEAMTSGRRSTPKELETLQLNVADALTPKVSETNALSNGLLQKMKAVLNVIKEPTYRYKNYKLSCPSLFQPHISLTKFRNPRHRALVIVIELTCSSDVEPNPGPDPGRSRKQEVSTIMVTSCNVRGLNDEAKLRHLIHYCYSKIHKDRDHLFFFQETFLTKPSKIPYLWRGNFHFTPGSGNGSGCITLVSSHMNIIETVDFGMRGHIIVLQKSGEQKVSYITVNIYAPCPNNQEKVTFFEEIFDKLSELTITYECNNVIVAGDFNLNFCANEVKNRNYPAQEKRVAQIVSGFVDGMGLYDVWKEKKISSYTWRRANTDMFSTIDRVLLSRSTLVVDGWSTNWSLSMSDHAAIELSLSLNGETKHSKSKITRLDPSLLKNSECKEKIVEGFETMLANAGIGWNPHLKLEYAKMCIRTVVEQVQAERKRKEKSEEDCVNEELNIAVISLENSSTNEEKEELIEYIEELREKKAQLVEEKGRRLAEKLGTKWYNEGEKSTRYFLNLLKRPAPDLFKTIIDNDGREISSQEEISSEIVNFYKKLYEDYDKTNLTNDSANDFFNLLDPIPASDADIVTKPITIQDLERTLLTCTDSAPGPDGIPYSFYKSLWRKMGPIIVEAWNYTIRTGILCPSHKVSFLKLIPKVGKDLKKLTNWRPITLSNCDHKLITKTYSNRMCSVIAQKIRERQTAYIKGRLINDNIRAILATIELTNNEADLDGLLVSLDAKKAFDSVEHSFIVKCLEKFGLGTFVPIFKILYSELKSDIIINGKITEGFCIRRGVKQGDALSCILFIMCMEPLLRNIEGNVLINELNSNKLGSLPKVYAYADDVNSIIVNSERGLQALFDEYERLTKASGLELNADKTEIMRLKRRPQDDVAELNFNIRYCGKIYQITTVPEVKINGILFQQNVANVVQANVDSVLKKVDRILRGWSARHLSVLGKILIVKTFAISQVIYLLQSMVLTDSHFKKINQLLFKFIWNRHYLAAKAPERISREIVNKPIKYGGLGMLDLVDLDRSLKLKALARLSDSNHPFLVKVKEKLDLSDFFHPIVRLNAESITVVGSKLLKDLRSSYVGEESIARNRLYIAYIKNIKIVNAISSLGKQSIGYLRLRQEGLRYLGELNARQVQLISMFLNRNLHREVSRVIPLVGNLQLAQTSPQLNILSNKKDFIDMRKLSSKAIRLAIAPKEPICLFKLGSVITPDTSLNWGYALNKVNSVKLKSTILRAAHGEIYTKEKLHRFGLIDSRTCPRCDEVETLQHKLIECNYVSRIWNLVLRLTSDLRTINLPDEDKRELIIGAVKGTTPELITIHAEVINRILYLKDSQNYLLRPKIFVRLVLEHIAKREKNDAVKDKIMDLLNRLELE